MSPRACLACLAVLIVTVSVGCCPCAERPTRQVDRPRPRTEDAAPRLAGNLLFDAKPGRFAASDVVRTGQWPSTDGYYAPPQVFSFRERFIDYQGRGFDESDYTYRRFDAVRVGTGYR